MCSASTMATPRTCARDVRVRGQVSLAYKSLTRHALHRRFNHLFLTFVTEARRFLYSRRRDWLSVSGALSHLLITLMLYPDRRLCMLFWILVPRTCGLPITSALIATIRPPYFKPVNQARFRPHQDRTLACSLSTGRARLLGLLQKIP